MAALLAAHPLAFETLRVAVFVLAFIPQFVDVTKGSTVLQFLIFGPILNVGGTTINALVSGF